MVLTKKTVQGRKDLGSKNFGLKIIFVFQKFPVYCDPISQNPHIFLKKERCALAIQSDNIWAFRIQKHIIIYKYIYKINCVW